ncbi:serine/threonine protein kinase [Sphaerisporangium perillae]|uniref:serine/threonine protein kinase n=1 Tax=Sphaerisporangium perillae TaxID=2935860 RepID=UPI00200C06E6|nr:serine/threonine-protein kinase [Sphaerisporangium perillae]
MTGIDPLRTGDPAHLGPYRLIGRLGDGGQGAVFLAITGSGEQVAVKLLYRVPDDSAPGRFLRETEILRQVSPFCTAQVVETGTADGRPYIVSEYIAGPTLQHAVDTGGPLRGGRLRRLAVGTMTALAAIHRAGVVHRDFKPSNVLLGGDGPRVIDFGIARALDVALTSSHAVGTPPYMAPEQFESGLVGPEADLFAWGATMVFAASGRPPFGADSIPAIVHRILRGEPDLGALDGDLRALAAECLSKDPDRRPTTKDALLRLIGTRVRPGGNLLEQGTSIAARPTGSGAQPTTGSGGLPVTEPGAQPTTVPGGRSDRRRVRIVLGAVTAAAALLAGGAIYAVASGGIGARARSGTPSPVAVREVTAAPATPTKDVRLPRMNAVLHENPGDPLRVTSLLHIDAKAGEARTYARVPKGDEFRQIGRAHEALVSPDGTWTALQPWIKPETPGTYDSIKLIRRATGEEFLVNTVRTPLQTFNPYWSADGRRLLLTSYATSGNSKHAVGFVVVDTATATATTVSADAGDDSDAPFMWAPGETGVAHRFPSGVDIGLRLFDLRGKAVRGFQKVGQPSFKESTFAPAGRRFATLCPSPTSSVCVWDVATGRGQATVPAPAGTTLIGWFNDAHLILADETKDPRQIVVVNLQGKVVRVLAEIPPAEYGLTKLLMRYTRT